MKIKIVTTEKKLTKSLISQMPFATIREIRHGIVIGYFRKVLPKIPGIFIIDFDDQYYVLPSNYRKGMKAITRRVGKWTSTPFQFETEEECDKWWGYYEKILNGGHQQVYI